MILVQQTYEHKANRSPRMIMIVAWLREKNSFTHGLALIVLGIFWLYLRRKGKGQSTRSLREKVKNCVVINGITENDPSLRKTSFDDTELQNIAPTSTPTERQRFLNNTSGNTKNAAKALTTYITWHNQLKSTEKHLFQDNNTEMTNDWERACHIACSLNADKLTTLPRFIRMYFLHGNYVTDRSGCRIMHAMPGQIDYSCAGSKSYATALGTYIDRKLNRSDQELVTLVVDLRGGKGWSNRPFLKQYPFVQLAIQLLVSRFPDRLHQCIIYPMPDAALWIWRLIRTLLDPRIAEKIHLLPGPATIASDPPYELMKQFLDEKVVRMLESERKADFLEDD